MENPECMDKLAKELCTAFPDMNAVDALSHEQVVGLPYLNAVLNESMRLRPVAANILPRVVPKSGATLCGHFIPGGVSRVVGKRIWAGLIRQVVN